MALVAPEVVHALEDEDREDAAAAAAAAAGARTPSPRFPIASAWRPEYGCWMVEATPGVPYGGNTSDLRSVEVNMAMR